MIEYILAALVFGITSGLKPGPLGVYVIQQTLEHGFQAGLRASFAPIITDGPIIVFTLIVLSTWKDITFFIALLSFLGGIYLIWIAYKIFNTPKFDALNSSHSQHSLSTAIKVNLLSPNPYLFWFTVGGAYIAQGSQAESLVFVLVSVVTLVLSKIAVAFAASNFTALLTGRAYFWVMRTLAALLAVFGLIFLSRSQVAWVF